MDNTNRKCIFRNDFLQGTQSNVGFSSSSRSRLLWTQLSVPYNCPCFHIVYLPCTSHKVLLNHYAAFVLTGFEQKERLPINVSFHLLIPLFC